MKEKKVEGEEKRTISSKKRGVVDKGSNMREGKKKNNKTSKHTSDFKVTRE